MANRCWDLDSLPCRDPDLPDELLPAGWKGHDAHALFLEAHDLLSEPAERFFSTVLDAGHVVDRGCLSV